MENTAIYEQLNSRIFSAILSDPNRAFSGFEFIPRGGHYESPCNPQGEKTRRKDKTILKNWNGVAMLLFNDESGEKTSAIKFYADLKGLQYGEATKQLCSIYNIEYPQNDSPEYKEYLQEQETKAEIFKAARKALFTEAGAPVYNYLIQGRGWSKELIEQVDELGAITPDIIKKFSAAKFWPNVVRNTTEPLLLIPVYSNNSLQGFKFRVLNAQTTNKYINSVGYKKGVNPFLLSGYKVAPGPEQQKGLIVVEGELDALHAKAKGFNNVIAIAGGEISEELAAKLESLGIIRVTLLLDCEKSEAGNIATARKAYKNISVLDKHNITGLVAEFPQIPGEKTDTDSYLLEHTAQDLQALLNNAINGSIYQLTQIVNKYTTQDQAGSIITYTSFVDLTKEIEELAAATNSPYNRDLICDEAERRTVGNIKAETIKGVIKSRTKAAEDLKQKRQFAEDIKAAATKAGELAEKGQTEKAAAALEKTAANIKRVFSENEFEALSATPDYNTFLKNLVEETPGLATGYYFGGRSSEDELLLPAGALTFVCGLPGHGKSRFMQNLAVNEAIKAKEGEQVIYITLEESQNAIFKEMANLYAGIELSANNLRTISSSYKNGSNFVKADKKVDYSRYKQLEGQFLKEYICKGKLQIISLDYGSNRIKEFIKYLIETKAPKIVFIDYMQLMYKEGNTKARHEELKDICREFNDLAKEALIPFVIGSQFNRQAYSPTEWSAQNISEASDIEKIANTIIAVWHSKAKPLIGSYCYRDDTALKKLESDYNFKFGEYGYMFAELLKNRFGKKNITTLLKWNENTGKITDYDSTSVNYVTPPPAVDSQLFDSDSEED